LAFGQTDLPDWRKLKPPRIFSEYQFLAGPSVSFGFGENFEIPEVTMVPKYGYTVGIGAKNEFIGRLSFWSHLLFEKRGWGARSSTRQRPEIVSEHESNRTYITFSFRPTVEIGRKKNLSIGIGGYAGRLIRREHHISEYLNGVLVDEYYVSGLSNSRLFDAGISAEIAYRVALLNKCSLRFHAMNFYGLTDVTNPNQPFLSIFLNTLFIGMSLNINL
jgi:hypothetical protein